MATPERAQRGFVVISQYRHYFTNWVWLQHVACQERTAGFTLTGRKFNLLIFVLKGGTSLFVGKEILMKMLPPSLTKMFP